MINKNKKLFLSIFLLALTAGLAVSFCFVPESWMRIIGADDQLSNQNDSNFSDSNGSNNGNNGGDNNSSSQKLEIYQAELFVQSEWGEGQGEVGLSNPSERGVEDASPNYGPQSFDIAENGHLFLLDSVNERVIEYDDQGKYLKDFPIACGGTGDIRVSPDNKSLYVFSWRCEGIYKYSIEGEFLEGYSVLPNENKSPGLCTEGLDFDESGNIMLELRIDDYDKACRFYQIGKTGNEWKDNNHFGHISVDGKEFYHVHAINKYKETIQILNRDGLLQKELVVKLPQDAYVYYNGCDKEGNIYLDVAFSYGSIWDDDSYLDHFIWKYNRKGNLIAEIDRSLLLQELFKEKSKQIILSNSKTNGYYTDRFKEFRVSSNGDVYWLASLKGKGLKIFKYSKIEN